MAWIVIGEREGKWPVRVSDQCDTEAEARRVIREVQPAERRNSAIGVEPPLTYRVIDDREYAKIALERSDVEVIDFEGEPITMLKIFDAMGEEAQVQEPSLSDDYRFSWTGKIEPVGRVKVVWTFTDGKWFVDEDNLSDLPWSNASYVTITRP